MSELGSLASSRTPARILHVLPSPGGGGETYIRQLEGMPGYRAERFHLTAGDRPSQVPAGILGLARRIGGYELVHVHGDSAALACLPLLGRRPSVITLHGAHLLRRSAGARAQAARAGLRRAFVRAAAVIAVSDSELGFAKGIAPRSTERIVLIRNGVPDPGEPDEAARRNARGRLGLAPESVAVLFAGELSERKQPLQLARAIRIARAGHPKIVGLMAGEGPLAAELAAMEDSGLLVLGHRDDVPELLRAADVFALPSLREGLSYALLEAMALGRATVVSDAPGNPDAVGDAGLVVAAGDVEAMAASISRLAADPELRASLGRQARARVRERFTQEEMRRETARVYERALTGGER